jgi:hypothetical protein
MGGVGPNGPWVMGVYIVVNVVVTSLLSLFVCKLLM